MALAFDAFSQSQVASGTTLTFSHTCTGSDRILVVGMSDENANATPTATYNGVSMTRVDTQDNLSIFYLVSPATGANNIVITRSGTTTNPLYGWGYSMTGASTSQPDNSTKGTASGVTSRTGTLTTVADNAWCVMVARADNAGMAPSTNSTEKSTPIAGFDGWAFFDNSGIAPITPAGSTSMTFTGTNGTLSYVMISIAPFVAPAGTQEEGIFNLKPQPTYSKYHKSFDVMGYGV